MALIASEEPQAFQFARDARIARRVGFANGWEKPFKSLWVRTQVTHSLYRPASAARERIHEVETLFALGAGLHSETVPTNDVRRLRPLIVDEPITPSGGVAIQVSAEVRTSGFGRCRLRAHRGSHRRAHRRFRVEFPRRRSVRARGLCEHGHPARGRPRHEDVEVPVGRGARGCHSGLRRGARCRDVRRSERRPCLRPARSSQATSCAGGRGPRPRGPAARRPQRGNARRSGVDAALETLPAPAAAP